LGTVCDFVNGFAFKSNLFKPEGLRIIRITNINGCNVDLSDCKFFDETDYAKVNLDNYKILPGDILIALSGATTGKIGRYNSTEIAYMNQRVGKFVPNKRYLHNRFLYHILLSNVDYFYNLAGGGAQPNLSSTKLLSEFKVPIPPLEVQERIATILDRFETLVNDLKQGLPAEIEARKQQYEYYRNQLLTFERIA
jgi:type I restriction enzyme S subunit